MTVTDFKKWLAIGTGVAIEIGREDFTVNVVRVRPSGAKVLGELVIRGFRDQAAGEWGATYIGFLKKLGLGHLSATVLLPRDEVTARQVSFPGVAGKDLPAAIGFEIDSLNPYSEEEVAYDWARIGQTSYVLIGITRRATLERYAALFSQAGIKVASFTFSAATIYSALRLGSRLPGKGFFATEQLQDEVEIYGESPARALFSARLDQTEERARILAVSELRLPPETEPRLLHDSLPRPREAPPGYDPARGCLSYAAALSAACPLPFLSVNLLPPEQRRQTSRMRYVPTLVLASLVLLLSGAALAYPKYADRRYLNLLRQQIQMIEPAARRAADLDRQTAVLRNRTQALDNFRRHTVDDMDELRELTQMLAAPAWLKYLQLTRDAAAMAGETDQAEALLKLLDDSHHLRNSAFSIPIARTAAGEEFSIRSSRQGITP